MVTAKELREQAIERVMREMKMSRETAERFVDRGEGRVRDVEDAPPDPDPETYEPPKKPRQ